MFDGAERRRLVDFWHANGRALGTPALVRCSLGKIWSVAQWLGSQGVDAGERDSCAVLVSWYSIDGLARVTVVARLAQRKKWQCFRFASWIQIIAFWLCWIKMAGHELRLVVQMLDRSRGCEKILWWY